GKSSSLGHRSFELVARSSLTARPNKEWYKHISTHMDSASLAQVHSRRKRLISLL
ncbi:unnamed protein product, partial [Linum tenue]